MLANCPSRSRLYSREIFCDEGAGTLVRVHLNLGVKWRKYGLKTWSILHGGRVVGHLPELGLVDVRFVVGQTGSELARRGRKTVHAYAVGRLAELGPEHGTHMIRYNPHEGMREFRTNMDRTAKVWGCDKLFLNSHWRMFGEGLVTGPLEA